MTADLEAVTRTLAEKVAAVLIGHQAAWVDDREARAGYYGFYECGCNEHGHLNGLLLTQDDVARHQAAEVAAVLALLPDDRLAEAEAKVQRVEKHMAFRERLGSDSSPHYEIRAALSGQAGDPLIDSGGGNGAESGGPR